MAQKKQKRGSGANFIRSLALTIPAKDVVAQAKAKGITIKESSVYSVRSDMRKRSRGKGKPKAKATAKKTAVTDIPSFSRKRVARRVDRGGFAGPERRPMLPLRTARAAQEELSAEEQLRVLVLRVGLDRTERLLQQLRRDTLVSRRVSRYSPLPPPID